MDTADLLRFLGETNQHGYAAGQNVPTVREADHSTTIVYEAGAWRFHDNYFGGEPYGGRAVGPGAEVQPVYAFLQRALLRAPADFPFRGPDQFTEAPFTYRNARRGDVQSFSGEEIIHHRGQPVYIATYVGGLVDRRRGD